MPTDHEDQYMHIDEVIDNPPLGILPRSYYVLKNAMDVKSCHETLDLRHPFSIYSISLSTIRQKMDRLLDLIVPLYTDPQALNKQREELDTTIREATDSILDALMEHFDDCENVLKCFLDQEMKEHKTKVFSVGQAGWKSYRAHVGIIVNQIKHNQRCVRTIMFNGTNWAVPGYFIEGPAAPGIIGPDPKIHPGGVTAFSFRRNLLFHLCGLYATSQSIAKALSMVNKRFADRSLAPKTTERGEEEWYKMLRRVESLSLFVFPDEVRKQNPVVKIKDGRLRVKYPSLEKAHSVPSPCTITISVVIDPVSLSYQVPYLTKS